MFRKYISIHVLIRLKVFKVIWSSEKAYVVDA